MIYKSLEDKNRYLSAKSPLMLLNYTFTVLFMLWALTPYLIRNLPSKYLGIILIGWMLSAALIILGRRKIRIIPVLVLIVVWIIWIVVLRLLGFSSASLGNYYMIILFWFSLFIYYFYINLPYTDLCRNTAFASIVILMANVIDNIRLLVKYPGATAVINAGFDVSYFYQSLNIGSTMFAFEVLLFISVLLSVMDGAEHKKTKLLIVVFIVLCIYYLIIASKTTALLLSVFSIVIYQFIKLARKGNVYSRLAFIVCSLAALIIFSNLLSGLLLHISSRINISGISQRIEALGLFLQNGNYEISSASFAKRIENWAISIGTFIDSPLIGIGFHKTMSFDKSIIGIGEHSEIFDNLAKYGIVGFMFLFSIFKKYYSKIALETKETKYFPGAITVFIVFIVYSFFNNSISPEIGVIMFLQVPLLPFLAGKYNKI